MAVRVASGVGKEHQLERQKGVPRRLGLVQEVHCYSRMRRHARGRDRHRGDAPSIFGHGFERATDIGAARCGRCGHEPARLEVDLAVLEAGGDFADSIMAHEGKWLGGETFVSFDKKAVTLLSQQGEATQLLA